MIVILGGYFLNYHGDYDSQSDKILLFYGPISPRPAAYVLSSSLRHIGHEWQGDFNGPRDILEFVRSWRCRASDRSGIIPKGRCQWILRFDPREDRWS
jgi:hypothetical protein